MQQRPLGLTGARVPTICLGTMTFGLQCDEAESFAILDRAAEGGIGFLDTADVYPLGSDLDLNGETEAIIGRWMKARGNRDRIFLATKCRGRMGEGTNDAGLSRFHIQRAVEASLKRLGTDCIDLYQLHGFDAMTPLEEVMQTLDGLVRAGKIRYIGCSNFSGWHLMKSLAVSDRYGLARHVAHQAYYSLVGRDFEWELMPLALDQGIGTVVWSPLAWGRLGGKFRRGQPLPKDTRLASPVTAQRGPQVPEEYLYRVVDALDAVAAECGKSVPQVALNWLLQRPSVTSIVIGARNETQLRDNLGAVGWKLTPAQIAKLDAASAVPLPYPYWHQRAIYGERNPPPV